MDGRDQQNGLPWPAGAPGDGAPGSGAAGNGAAGNDLPAEPGTAGSSGAPGRGWLWGAPHTQPVWPPPTGVPVPGAGPAGQPAGGQQIGLGPNTRCYVHPDRLAGAICRSCNRPICADCMVQAPVGWHCRECTRREAKKSPVVRYRPRTGGAPGAMRSGPMNAPVTTVLIAVNVVLYLAASASASLTFNSYEVPILIQRYGQWYRLFSSFFITNNFTDIALNMVSLLIIGRLVEPALGKWRFLALYLLAGFGGSVATYLLGGYMVASAGASGAIFGIFGAYFVVARRAALNTSGIIAIIAINLLFDFTVPGINWLAHLGGLATGLVVAAGFGIARGRRQELGADVAVVACATVVLGLLMLLPPGTVNIG